MSKNPTQPGVVIDEISDSSDGSSALRKYGLHLTALRQISKKLDFESPARIASATVIGDCAIGAFSYTGPGSEIRNAKIGRFCSIAANVAIGPAQHPVDWLSSHPFQFDGVRYFDESSAWGVFANRQEKFLGNSTVTTVGHDVWIGRNAIIRQGVKIGHGAVVAGHAFVNRDVEPYAIVGGVPARILRYRFPPDVIENLLRVKWWSWELNSAANSLSFSDVEKAITQLTQLIDGGRLLPFQPALYSLMKSGSTYELNQFPVGTSLFNTETP